MTDDIIAVLRANLTPAQCSAAVDPAREVLTLACAGSGKSRTLAFRIARLVAQERDPRSIVAFTFTEKAAEAIKLQVARALSAAGLDPTILGAMYIGTIHAYCQDVLAEMDARYRRFDVLDENRLKLYLISRYPELELHRVREAKKPAPDKDVRYFDVISQVADAWKIANDEMVRIEDVTAADEVLGRTLTTLRNNLDRDGYIDFSLMIRLVVDALVRKDPGAERAVARVRHLMVDEYQDVNPSQEALIRELHARIKTLFVVGDDDQAIYSWRGADVSNILEFRERYPQCSEHTLSRNFRSTPPIVQAADAFAAAELGARRITKNPQADDPGQPQDFRNLWFGTRALEAAWVVGMIERLLGTAYRERDGQVRGLTPGDFAILMRSTRQPEQDETPRHTAFTSALASARGGAGIPYTLEAGGGVFDRPHVRVLRDSFELLRTSSPDRTTVRNFFDAQVQPVFPQARFEPCARVFSDWGKLIHSPGGGDSGGGGGPRRRVYPQQLVHDLLQAFGLERSAFDDAVMQDLGIFSRIIQDVETVYLSVDSARRFQDILNFLSNVAESGYDTSTQDLLLRPDAVTVSTVHRVKGLEFPVVFVVDVENQRFPKKREAYRGWLPPGTIQTALARGAYQSTASEEARLFYTAITRAERYLYVTGAASLPAGKKARQPSSFARRLAHPAISVNPNGLPAGLEAREPQRRIDETVMPTSYSDIKYYLRCPRDYLFRKSFGFSPPITEMFGFGQAVHASVGKLHELFPQEAPDKTAAEQVARDVFHLKHVPRSRSPEENPGPYERALDSAARILGSYAEEYAPDFQRQRQIEARFEIPVDQAVISGSIDLLLKEDASGRLLTAEVIDFKAVEGGEPAEESEKLQWTELALQVQLYARAATQVLGENARTGAVHLLKDNKRVVVPVSDAAVSAAVANVEWAVKRIIAGDFPMRAQEQKCGACDFKALCSKGVQEFETSEQPPAIHIPSKAKQQMARAFSEVGPIQR